MNMNKKNLIWIIPLALLAGVALISLYIWATQSLWNWLIPEIFDGPMISFGQTAGLMLLVCMFSWIAIGGKGGRHHHHDKRWKRQWKHKWKNGWRNEWCNMSEEERSEWRRRFREGHNSDIEA